MFATARLALAHLDATPKDAEWIKHTSMNTLPTSDGPASANPDLQALHVCSGVRALVLHLHQVELPLFAHVLSLYLPCMLMRAYCASSRYTEMTRS
jgi:hypothetical protein